jgi:hypothetical protein
MPEDVPVFDPPTTCGSSYTSIPTSITAEQWDGTEEHAQRIVEWMESHVGRGCACLIPEQEPIDMGYVDNGKPILLKRPARIVIGLRTGGQTDLFASDWLIQGVENEFYPCPDSVFQRKYRATANG